MRLVAVRILPAVLLAAGVLLAFSGPAAAEYPPGPVDRLHVTDAGAPITLSGGGFAPGSEVTVRPTSADAEVASPVTVRADGDGQFEADVQVPELAAGVELRYVAEGVGPDGGVASTEWTINVLQAEKGDVDPSPAPSPSLSEVEVSQEGMPGVSWPAVWALLGAGLAGAAVTSVAVRRRLDR